MTSEVITVEPSEMRLGIIPARTPHDVIVQATAIAKELAGIVKTNHLSRNIQGREYVQVEGWSTMGAMLGVLPREIPEMFKTFEDGSCEATVELIRISDGAVIGRASAFVGMDEKDRNGKLTWGSRPLYARRSMSVTRATGKAYRLGFSWIMGLAGYAPTPAEEMDGIIGADIQSEPEQSRMKKAIHADQVQEYQDTIRTIEANKPVIPANGEMTLEEAKKVTDSKGRAYGTVNNAGLVVIERNITNKMNKETLDNATQSRYEMALKAISTILRDDPKEMRLIPVAE